ncbi:fucolectin-3-like [Gambusia affinis]|uniref:fucolectin-3-like n=1 Tax=Gambusia affinis TaxID=33528 RepID=UPI001CDBE1D1|nr:fucolectin-3-like [Gambusia affinis]XP_043973756.1 fucolectin-3-like [Gambusia affinis]XP_043973757.1 fucolectin-3-like [Gambusia affinis]
MMWGLLPILLIGRLYVTQQTTDCRNQPVIDLTDTNASQSSTSANNYNQLTNADRASDGNPSTCSLTLFQNNSWWRIDLQGVHNISCVCIYNKNCSRLNLKPAEIYVGYSLKDNGKLAYNITEFKAGQINVFKFPKSVFGRYVTVVRPGQKAMVLCDVNITGTTIKPPFCDDD